MEQMLRSVFLSLAKNKSANRMAKRYGLHLGAQKFVSGETIDSAIDVIRRLNAEGMSVTLDHLGEFVKDEFEAKESADVCVRTLDAIHVAGVQATLSVKMTQLGLDIRRDLCMENMRRILGAAEQLLLRVNIDMEDHTRCQVTLDIYEELRESFDNVDIVVQAYLYRSLEDITRLAQEGARVRIVKGAYKEPQSVAFADKADVDRNFVKMAETMLLGPGFAAIATHDERIIEHCKLFIGKHQIPTEKYEFQMLYGIRTDLQKHLVQEGYPVRVYVPYGDDWYGYFMRRLAERPANVAFVMRGMLH